MAAATNALTVEYLCFINLLFFINGVYTELITCAKQGVDIEGVHHVVIGVGVELFTVPLVNLDNAYALSAENRAAACLLLVASHYG